MKTHNYCSLAAMIMAILASSVLFAPVTSVRAVTGRQCSTKWGNRFRSLELRAARTHLRTQVRTPIAQMAMFDAVNAAFDRAYRPFTSKPVSVPGASRKLRLSVQRNIVALNEFPTQAGDHQQRLQYVDRRRFPRALKR